jgi:hypothetical protein
MAVPAESRREAQGCVAMDFKERPWRKKTAREGAKTIRQSGADGPAVARFPKQGRVFMEGIHDVIKKIKYT